MFLGQSSFNVNTEFVKYAVLILSAPFWIPFLKRIWRELNGSLREEGGVFGRLPSPSELEEIRRKKRRELDPLVNEPLAHSGRRPTPAPRGGEGRTARRAGGAAPGRARTRFRDTHARRSPGGR